MALRILFRIFSSDERQDIWDGAESKITLVCSKILRDFAPEVKDIWGSSVVLLIRELLNLDDDRVCRMRLQFGDHGSQFQKHASLHYEAFASIVGMTSDTPLGDVSFLLGAFYARARTYPL